MPRPHLPRRALLIVLAVLLLVALPLGWYVYDSSRIVQMQRLEAARVRWEARPFAGYDLHVTYEADTPQAPPQAPRTTIYRVEEEGQGRAGLDTTVTSHFILIERYLRDEGDGYGCAALRLLCIQPASSYAYATYDPELGHPTSIIFTITRHHDWTSPAYWQFVWNMGLWRDCTNLRCTTTTTYEYDLSVSPLSQQAE